MAPEVAPPGLSASPTLVTLLRSLRRRWLVAFTLGGLLAVAAAGAAWFLLSPSYTAFAQIHVFSKAPEVGGYGLDQGPGLGTYIKSQAAIIKSRPILQDALKRDEVKRLGLETKHPEPAVFLESRLTTEFQDNSELLIVKFSSDDASEATTILKAITEAYMEYVSYGEKHNRTQEVAELEKVLNETNLGLKKKRTNLNELARNLDGLDKEALQRQREEIMSNVRDLRAQRVSMRIELARANGQLESHTARVKALEQIVISDPMVDAELEKDPVARPLLGKIERLQSIVDDFDRAGQSSTPTRVRADQLLQKQLVMLGKRRTELRVDLKERALARARQDQQVAKVELTNTIATLEDQLKKLDGEVKVQLAQVSRIAGSSNDVEMLQQEISQDQRTAEEMASRLSRLKVAMRSPDRIAIHQFPELMAADSRKQMLAAVGSPVGVLFLVCMAVAWGDFRKRRIHAASEVVQGLGLPVLGAIPDVPHLERRLLDLETDPALDGHPVLEAFDGIRTVLLHEAAVSGCRVVLVASSGPGEGKTTLAGHLAASLARAGRKTLLIDGDLRRPNLHDLFGLPMQPGFSEVLLGEVEPPDAVQQTPQENLALLPAGQWDREVIGSLARDGLGTMLENLRQAYDFILIDSHPLLEATDALLIGQQADAVILAALRQVSQLPRLYTASRRLQSLRIRLLGTVINGVDPNEVICTAGAVPAALQAA